MTHSQPGQDPEWDAGRQRAGHPVYSWPQQPQPGQQPPSPGRRTGFGMALLAALVWPVVNALITLFVLGLPPTAGLAGRYVGFLLLPTLLAALAVSLIARRSAKPWRFPLLVALALPFYLVVRLLTMSGGAGG